MGAPISRWRPTAIEKHWWPWLNLAVRRLGEECSGAWFLDGRDTPPKSAQPSCNCLKIAYQRLSAGAHGRALIGRYFCGWTADNRWDRVRKQALSFLLLKARPSSLCERAGSMPYAGAYERGESDEFVKATRVGALAEPVQGMRDWRSFS